MTDTPIENLVTETILRLLYDFRCTHQAKEVEMEIVLGTKQLMHLQEEREGKVYLPSEADISPFQEGFTLFGCKVRVLEEYCGIKVQEVAKTQW